ncbi:MAG TPA: hypothetical protein VHE81_07575, partial [Lacipirellulaceae bacterium]|nr:hypothetical protein [Lacipirellulaceae bacterium]
SVSHMMSGQQIVVNASIDYLDTVTATVYGPHEYLHPLGTLGVGEYHLTLNIVSNWGNTIPSAPFTSTGYIDFAVQAVPEPSALILAAISFMLLLPALRPERNVAI